MDDLDLSEHDKMRAISQESQAIGAFLEWLPEAGYQIARWERLKDCLYYGQRDYGPLFGPMNVRCTSGYLTRVDTDDIVGICEECGGTGEVERLTPYLTTYDGSIEKILAQFFDIDLDKIEQEKQAILDRLRQQRRGGR